MTSTTSRAEGAPNHEAPLPTDGSMLAPWEAAIRKRLTADVDPNLLQTWTALQPLTAVLRPRQFGTISLVDMHVEPMAEPLRDFLAAVETETEGFIGTESPALPKGLDSLDPRLIEGYSITANAVNVGYGLISPVTARVWYVVKEGPPIAVPARSGLDLLRYVSTLQYDELAFENFRRRSLGLRVVERLIPYRTSRPKNKRTKDRNSRHKQTRKPVENERRNG